jgi:chaperone required for assembly of F1-ATPase
MSTANDPIRLAQARARPVLPKRFYRSAEARPAEGGSGLLLDGRQARTPGGAALVVRSPVIAEAMAVEWAAQGTEIDAASMPVTRIVNAAIDSVVARRESVAADIVAYAGSDLLCYRAEAPVALVRRQEETWGPVLDWARRTLDTRFILAAGIMPVAQPATTLARIAEAVAAFAPLPLAALHVATTLTGSALLALAVATSHLTAAAAWSAAHVDEDWQWQQWGVDAEAEARRARRWREMEAAALILAKG